MLISVIIPIYNSESYIKDCIDSIINQTIGFIKHIDIILINDGSIDSTHDICLKYKNEYPNNIKYLKIKNSGPSAARNTGLKAVSPNTKFIVFLDADDKLELNAVENGMKFFKNNPTVNIGVMPVYFFENKKGPIKLNNRFTKKKDIININEDYNYPQFYIGGVIVRRSLLLKLKISFVEDIHFWEDALFINYLIISEKKYGLIRNTKYWYRQRETKNSLVNKSWEQKSRYLDIIEYGYNNLIYYSIRLYGHIIPYVQYLVVYHLKLFTFQKNSNNLIQTLDFHELKVFIESVKDLLKLIDKKYIINQDTRNIHIEFLLYLKTNKMEMLVDNPIAINSDNAIKITNVKIKFPNIILNGYFSDESYSMKSGDYIYLKLGWKKIFTRKIVYNEKLKIWGISMRDYKHSAFSAKIPFWFLVFQFYLSTNKKEIKLNRINTFKHIIKKLIKFSKTTN